MSFEKGETLYTKNGTAVEFDHAHEGVAYVYPLITRIIQCTTYSGDDFHEDEDIERADHLIAVPLTSLSATKPVEILDAEIAEKRAVLKMLEVETNNAKRLHQAELKDMDKALADKSKELQEWCAKYPLIAETVKFIEGVPMFPLAVYENHYTHVPAIPTIPKPESLRYIRLRPVQRPQRTVRKPGTEDDKLEWVAVSKNRYSEVEEVQQLFFETEEARTAHIAAMFEKVCTAFRARPDFSAESYSTDLNYGTLCKWYNTHSVKIPDDIIEGKKAADAALAEQRRQALLNQLAALEAQ